MTETTKLNKSLSIRLTPNGLSFCTYTPLADVPFVYKKYDVQPTISLAANLKAAFQTEPMLKEEYQRVNVLITNAHTTYLPVNEFKAENIEDIYCFNFPKDTSMRVTYNVLRRSGIAIVFGIDRIIHQLIADEYPRARFYASSSTLIEYFSSKSFNSAGSTMHAYLHEKEATLFAFKQGQMLWSNSFDVSTTADSIYYILNAYEHLGLNHLDTPLHIVGDTGNEQNLMNQIQNFIKDVIVDEQQDNFQSSITQGAADIPYDLHTLLICGF